MLANFLDNHAYYIDKDLFELVSNDTIDISKMTKTLFGFESKQAKKIVAEKVCTTDTFNYVLAKLIYVCSSKLKMNKDIVFNASLNSNLDIDSNKEFSKHITPAVFKRLKKHYNESRLIKLIFNNELEYLLDINRMFIRIEKTTIDYTLPKKPKSLKEIHDKLMIIIARLECNDFDLKQREDVLILDGKKLESGLTIRVPKTHYDLVTLGETLNFCIGNGSYSDLVKNGTSSIVALFDKKGAKYGIQFNRYRIQEAQGFSNYSQNRPDKYILRELSDVILETPETPDDFIAIVGSFISGYRYDNENLYMLLNDIMYVYHNVPQSVYEELHETDRKGVFFGKHIRNKYSYARLS